MTLSKRTIRFQKMVTRSIVDSDNRALEADLQRVSRKK
ncbi:predicted protein [Sclerotinia sclerotiorum 1980 UF-70]|uniref:Uncharacterized protein n=1 Tax=Sclerotinia sclerotiorum (strain ATCC 18683 / 1980 / Ss-1) TaxID=665079 RepID=A7EBW9_SCLS1|nr:predicted protein [Sclerotinia sclerotiorum 1980 UF-70]EDN99947.1 predicted protein [Sclerotinia sclerotiorum 1980 UF-70]